MALNNSDGPTPRNPSKNRQRNWILAGLAGFSLLAGFLLWLQSDQPKPRPVAVPVELTGQIEALFDGKEIDQWRILGGELITAVDGEGALVLMVEGTVRRKLPGWKHYRLTMGMNLRSATSAQLHFGLKSGSGGNYVLHISDKRILVGVMTDDGSKVATILVSRNFPVNPWAEAADDAPIYREVRLDREPGRWLVLFNGDTIAELPAPDANDRPEIGLAAQGSAIALEGVLVSELREQAKQR